MAHPLYVCFVWHMHQPSYKDSTSGEYTLPWVRLHATKDYLHVAELIADYPEIHQTINVVPSLGEQILDYGAGRAVDRALALSEKHDLTLAEKKEILDSFFSLNWDRFLWPVPRYALLARLRELVGSDAALLSDAYFRDLKVWFNLGWLDPSLRERDPGLRALVEKAENFDQTDLELVLNYHRDTCARILPAYRRLSEAGQVELSTSPYYHPILPLLIDLNCARDASPSLDLPRLGFAHPEDAAHQIERAIRFHQDQFGRAPAGLWPSEGAVSQATVELIGNFPGIRWVATDEHVLERALGTRFSRDGNGQLDDPHRLCQPYQLNGQGPTLFFRDQILSDRIGFVYQHMESPAAADDLIQRLRQVAEKLAGDPSPHVISIVLDGENCWEFYPNNGDDFLRALFAKLRDEPLLQTVTPSEYLDRFPVDGQLDRLPAASWINANLETWIGEPSQNRGWEFLARARTAVTEWEQHHPSPDPECRQRAWDALRVAEGSDWFWWYYSRNQIGGSELFDVLYRQHLANVYGAIGEPIPAWLRQPNEGDRAPHDREAAGPMSPGALRAERDAADAWANAGYAEPEASTGAMQAGATALRRFYFGYTTDHLYFRLETFDAPQTLILTVYLRTPNPVAGQPLPPTVVRPGPTDENLAFNWRLDLAPAGDGAIRLATVRADGQWALVETPVETAWGEQCVEARVATEALGIGTGDQLDLIAVAGRQEQQLEAVPRDGVITLAFELS